MKFLIASDIHGSAFYTQKVLDIAKKEKADKIVLLGDIFNHGPRNPLPTEYAPLKVAQLLNAEKENLIVVEGNCDSQVDTMIAEFDFIKDVVLISGNKTVLCTHGHVYNKDQKPKTRYDAVIYGHFHTGFIEEKEGTLYVNAGSVSLPKNSTPASYVILEDGNIELKNLDGEMIAKA